MTSRERVLSALHLEKPDRVPYVEIGIDPALAEKQVEAEAAALIRDLGSGGGYILSSANSLTSYVPVENAMALARAVASQTPS
jgi:uroporphyrinogen-III decarboxylase